MNADPAKEKISFKTPIIKQVLGATARTMDRHNKESSIGPLVFVDKAGFIHITAHFLSYVDDKKYFKIPASVSVSENRTIEIYIAILAIPAPTILRSQWELTLIYDKDESTIDFKELTEVDVQIYFNEEIKQSLFYGEPKRGTRVIPT
jgi:hypothetical protein